MKLATIPGLILAVAAMAVIGVSSAMATNTVLCEENVLVCPAGKKLEHVHIEGLALNPELSGKFFGITGTIKCEHSVFLGKALLLAAPLVVHIELIDFTGNCHILGPFINEPCAEFKSEALGLLDVLKTAPNLGQATSLGTTIKMHCGGLINCVLGGEPAFHALGSEGALSSSSLGSLTSPTGGAVVSNISGSVCPEGGSSRWTAKYSILLPHQAFIAE
jgi:hypothetical protein